MMTFQNVIRSTPNTYEPIRQGGGYCASHRQQIPLTTLPSVLSPENLIRAECSILGKQTWKFNDSPLTKGRRFLSLQGPISGRIRLAPALRLALTALLALCAPLSLQGQCRIRLMDNLQGADCGYPGVELLPDGTFVLTSYGHWSEGEEPYLVSVRLNLGEFDP